MRSALVVANFGLVLWLAGTAAAPASATGEDYELLTVHMDSATVLKRSPAGRVLDSDRVHHDRHLLARSYWTELPHPNMSPWKQPGSSWRLVEANPRLRRHAPLFGEHNVEVLGGLLGLSPSELEELAEAGIIGNAPVNPGIG